MSPLVTTLFRVALSVASTRQILLNAEAGHIIAAFGEIVVGGNLIVGLVIFLVLTVANLVCGFQALGTLMAVGLMMLPVVWV